MDAEEMTGLLDAGGLFEVLEHDHPDLGWYVALDGELAAEHDQLVEALVASLRALPEVSRVVREDREVVLLGGDLDRSELERFLASWFRTRSTDPG